MSVKVNAMEFFRGLFWENQFNEPVIAEEEFFDLDGGVVSQFIPIGTRGRPISWVAIGSDSGGQGVITQEQIDYIKSLELSQEIVTLTYGSIVVSARVRSSSLSVTPLRKMPGHTNTDIYYGSIKFVEV